MTPRHGATDLGMLIPSFLPHSDDMLAIKAELGRLTGRNTWPNVLLRSRAIGGSDDLQNLHMTGTLAKLLQSAGLSAQEPK